MKKLLTTLFAISSLFSAAQTPSALGINYQSIIRNTGGTAMVSTPVTIEFKLYSTTTFTNVLLYDETHSTTTNQFGMANVVIGQGTVVGGAVSFNNIPWIGGIAYEVYVNSNIVGTRQPFLSVPYALASAYAPAPNVTFSNNVLSVGGNTVSITAGSTYTAGTDISITSGSVITNTTPDKTVTITGTGAATVTSAYPNFTVNVPSGSSIPPTIIGAGATSVTTAGTSYTVNTPVPTVYSAGSDISIGSGSVITNTAPDKTVSITGTGATIVSGIYPNFTINSPIIAPSTIIGTGATSVTSSGNSFTVNTNNQTLSISGDSISISGAGGNTIVLPTPSSPWQQGSGLVHLANSTDNVGIGTTSPVATLDVSGNLRVNDKIFLGNVGGINSGYTGIYEESDDLKLAVFKPTAAATTFAPAGNSIDALVVKSQTGYVGIGTPFPAGALHVVNNYTVGIGLTVGISDSNNPSRAVDVTQNGLGDAGHFEIGNSSNASSAIYGRTGGVGPVISADQFGTGRAADFRIYGSTNNQAVIFAQTGGLGTAGYFETFNPVSTNNAITAATFGTGNAIFGNHLGTSGHAGYFNIPGGSTNTSSTLFAANLMTGNAFDAQANTGAAITAINTGSLNATINATNSQDGNVVFANATRGRAYYGMNTSNVGLSTMELASNGNGNAIFAYKGNSAPAGNVAQFSNNSTGNTSDAVLIGDNGQGNALYAAKIAGTTSGNTAKFDNLSTINNADAVIVTNNGAGAAIRAALGSTVTGSTNLGLVVENGHIGSMSSANLTIVASCTTCTAPTVTLDNHSTDIVGTLRAVFSGTPAVIVDLNVTFTKPYKKRPVVIVNVESTPDPINSYPKYLVTPIGVVGNYTGFKISIIQGSVNIAGSYGFNYMVIEGKN